MQSQLLKSDSYAGNAKGGLSSLIREHLNPRRPPEGVPHLVGAFSVPKMWDLALGEAEPSRNLDIVGR